MLIVSLSKNVAPVNINFELFRWIRLEMRIHCMQYWNCLSLHCWRSIHHRQINRLGIGLSIYKCGLRLGRFWAKKFWSEKLWIFLLRLGLLFGFLQGPFTLGPWAGNPSHLYSVTGSWVVTIRHWSYCKTILGASRRNRIWRSWKSGLQTTQNRTF